MSVRTGTLKPQYSVARSWFNILKNKQTKLPSNLTAGATVDSKSKHLNPPPLESTDYKRKEIKREANQTQLNITEEE